VQVISKKKKSEKNLKKIREEAEEQQKQQQEAAGVAGRVAADGAGVAVEWLQHQRKKEKVTTLRRLVETKILRSLTWHPDLEKF